MAAANDGVAELGADEARATGGGGLLEWLFGFGGSGQTSGGGGGAGY